MSVDSTAAASVRVTVRPLMTGAVALRATSCSLPFRGVFFTPKALFARLAAAARSSLKVIVSDVPSTAADETVGAVVSATVLIAINRVFEDDFHVGVSAAASRQRLSLAMLHPVAAPASSAPLSVRFRLQLPELPFCWSTTEYVVLASRVAPEAAVNVLTAFAATEDGLVSAWTLLSGAPPLVVL